MKGLSILKKYILLLTALVFLTGCQEEEFKKVDLKFLKLSTNSEYYKGAVAIYESDSEEKYYESPISSYEYNHWKLKKSDVVNSKIEDKNFGDILADEYTYNAKINGKETVVHPIEFFEKK